MMSHSESISYSRIPAIGAITFFIIMGLCQCAKPVKEESVVKSQVNTSHLDALYGETKVGEDTVGFIHIYSEYPDYHMVGDDDEGFACVDDATRASIFYLRQYAVSKDPAHLRKGKMLVKFLLAMQAPNGYYYNFIWPDGRIHTDGSTSKPEPNFWSWRVLWAFGEAINVLDAGDTLVSQMRQQRELLVRNILAEPSFQSDSTGTTLGYTFPTWLPKYSGTDQAAIIVIGLSLMIQQTVPDQTIARNSLVTCINYFADGITMMQIEQPGTLQDGAFMSWENVWHAYANIQAYALLLAGEVINDPHLTAHALYEVDHFYPTILKLGGLEHFSIQVVDGKISIKEQSSFSQIAYGRRPMIWAALKAYDVTGDQKYWTLAKDLSAWFSGQNPANFPMYDPLTGRGYDGISSAEVVNKNAGAESTIEALLSIQALEQAASKIK